jgi:translation initiation factor 4A
MTTSPQPPDNIQQSIQSSELIDNWDDFDLKPDLLRGIYNCGFEKPSNIQQKAIPALISGRDIIGQAQSGTGKTGTFSIGTLQIIDTTIQQTQAIACRALDTSVQRIYGTNLEEK